MNIYDYYVNAKKVSNGRNYTSYSPQNIISNIVVDTDKQRVVFDVRTQGSKPGEIHISLLEFNTPISTEIIEDSKYNEVTYEGVTYYIPVLDKFSDIKVWCSCPDYSFTFDFYNYNNDLSCGKKPEPYESKGMRPPRNPEHFNGVCKHLYQAFLLLQRQGYVVP